MKPCLKSIILLLSFILLAQWPEPAKAEEALPPSLRGVGFDQRLNEQVPLDLTFTDEAGKPVTLADYFDGRPVILVLAYYRCPMLCNQVLNGLVQGMMEMPFIAGKEFRVLTVSFDPRETPELAAAKRRNYLKRYGHPEAAEGWHFLTGKQEAITRLTQSVGFRYTYDPKSDQFAHASGILLLTPSGKISRYFYDVHYSGRDLRLGLVEASENKIGSPVDQILLYCFHYDPEEGKYGAAVMNFVRAGGALTLLSLISFVGVMFWRDRRKSRGDAQGGT